jgi:hypothetical protein
MASDVQNCAARKSASMSANRIFRSQLHRDDDPTGSGCDQGPSSELGKSKVAGAIDAQPIAAPARPPYASPRFPQETSDG